jgi:hypothetical protein
MPWISGKDMQKFPFTARIHFKVLTNIILSQYAPDGHVVRGPAPLPLALAHCETGEDGKILFTTWSETDFRTNGKPWWT